MKQFFLMTLLTTFLALPSTLNAQSFAVDPSHSAIIFSAQHMGAGHTYGRFMRFSGSFQIGKTNTVTIEADTNSVFTADKQRDKHLRSPDFLNAKQFPKISFKSTSVKKSGKSYHVKGELSLHGITKVVMLKMNLLGQGKNRAGKKVVGFEGRLKIKRSDFGIKKMVGPVSDMIHLIIAIEGVEK